MKYRSEIDGLRALALIPAIFYHAGFDAFSGGFIGADMFFVISGYLITTIIFTDLAKGQFSIVDFYERRARRILPALFFVMLVCLPFAGLWLSPIALKDFGQSLVAASTFSANILFAIESGYFESVSDLKPLLHTWSLSVEEQYYILFPAFLLVFWKFGVRLVLSLLVLLFLVSIGIDYSIQAYDPRGFYMPYARAWEFLLGSFAACYLRSRGFLASSSVNQALSLLGFGMIVYSIIAFDPSISLQNMYAVYPALGTCLIILAATPGTVIYRLLSLPPLIGIGLISYSAYLWHQPLLAFARHWKSSELSDLLSISLCFFSFVLAYFSWRWVETPFRKKDRYTRRYIFGFAASGMAFFILIGGALHIYKGFASGKWLHMMEVVAKSVEHMDDGRCLRKEHQSNIYYCLKGDPAAPPTYALLGDSHAGSIATTLGDIFFEEGASFLQYTKSSCPNYFDIRTHPNTNCNLFLSNVYVDLMERNIKNVIILNQWTAYLSPEKYLTDINRVKQGHNLAMTGDDLFPEADHLRKNSILIGYYQFIRQLKTNGINVYVFLPVPFAGENVITEMVRLSAHSKIVFPSSLKYEIYADRNRGIVDLFDYLSSENIVTVLGDVNALCPLSPLLDRVCLNNIDGEILYVDDNHLTMLGAEIFLGEVGRNIFHQKTLEE